MFRDEDGMILPHHPSNRVAANHRNRRPDRRLAADPEPGHRRAERANEERVRLVPKSVPLTIHIIIIVFIDTPYVQGFSTIFMKTSSNED
jgi:hypothetical protein